MIGSRSFKIEDAVAECMVKAAGGMKRNGICFLCGQETGGISAKEDMLIRCAREIRRLLRLRERHTVACPGCMAECAKRRAGFEKELKGYRLGAALFFFLTAAGAAFFGRLDAPALAGALCGAAIIALLPYAGYCPAFQTDGEKARR